MNIFNKVTLQSLKRNKTRTLVTIIGIILSASMICAVTTLVSSVYNYALEYTIYNNGSWHGSAYTTTISQYEQLKSDSSVKEIVYNQNIGYAIAKGCTNDYKPYIFIIGAGKNFNNLMPVHITSGKYPTSTDEILLPNHLAENGEVRHSIGDVITLDIGDRVSDGYVLGQNNPLICDDSDENVVVLEELKIRDTKTYTVVGFYERPGFESYSAPGYTAITLEDTTSTSGSYDIYFKLKKPKNIYDFMKNNNLSGETNDDVLTYSGVSNFGSFDTIVIGLSTIIISLIIFGSVSLIYNAFSISVSERTKQFGLLTSIGATKKQLKKMVVFEALFVSIIGIPLGIIAGIAGIGITLLFIGDRFEIIMDLPVPLKLNVSPIYIIIAIIISLITVFISVWIPSKRATKISAVEAIRQNYDIRITSKNVKTSKLLYNFFGLPGILAMKNYKRSKQKYRATVISLFMSIVLFISSSSFTDYLVEMAEEGFNTHGYDIAYHTFEKEFTHISKDELLNQLKDDDNVTAVSYATKSSYSMTISKSSLSSQALKYSHHFAWDNNKNSDEIGINTSLIFVNDATFKELLREYNLDEMIFYNISSPLALAIDSTTLYDSASEKYIKFNMLSNESGSFNLNITGDVIEDSQSETASDTNIVPLKYGKVIDDYPYFCNNTGDGDLIFIYPYSFINIIFANSSTPPYSCTYYFKSNNHSASYNAIKETLNANSLSRSSLYDYAAGVEEERNMVTIIKTFAYGFIILISLIAAANVFNTISTNISLRRREFAMLKSVGITSKGINRMMNFECLLYGSKALLYGLPTSLIITIIIFIIVSDGYMFNFHLPLPSVFIAVLSVFAVVFATMIYSMHKIKRENPIDALKNENI